MSYAMNGPIKIALEYGIFGLLFYLTLILGTDGRRGRTRF